MDHYSKYLMWIKTNKNKVHEQPLDAHLNGHRELVWPPRSYSCGFCTRQFRSAQALGGHMNVHRRDRARLKQQQDQDQDQDQDHDHEHEQPPAAPAQLLLTPAHDSSSSSSSRTTSSNKLLLEAGGNLCIGLSLASGNYGCKRVKVMSSVIPTLPFFLQPCSRSISQTTDSSGTAIRVAGGSFMEDGDLDLELRLGSSSSSP